MSGGGCVGGDSDGGGGRKIVGGEGVIVGGECKIGRGEGIQRLLRQNRGW